MLDTLPMIATLINKAETATTREEAQKVLQQAEVIDNLAAQWLDDTEQIEGQLTK